MRGLRIIKPLFSFIASKTKRTGAAIITRKNRWATLQAFYTILLVMNSTLYDWLTLREFPAQPRKNRQSDIFRFKEATDLFKNMGSHSPPIDLPIDHDFGCEEMLHFPRDPADRGTYSIAEPLAWPPLARPGIPKDWEHRGDHEFAEKLSPKSRCPDFEARTFYFEILRQWLLAAIITMDANYREPSLSFGQQGPSLLESTVS